MPTLRTSAGGLKVIDTSGFGGRGNNYCGAVQTIMMGETWNFQAGHRDGVGLGPNFTDGLEIAFL